MGTIYRQAGRHNWMIKYYRNGRPIVESSGTDDKTEAKNLLKTREGDIARGLPLGSKVGRIRFEEAAVDILNDYRVNQRRSLNELSGRIGRHLTPHFGKRRMAAITTAEVRAFVVERQTEGAANASINRELAALKRMFSLAVQAGKLLHRPYIPMLREDNVRTGFFERQQFEDVRGHLPEYLRGVVTFAYLTGWRIPSEVLMLQWRQIDMKAGTVRLDPGTTKNDEGRLFPFSMLPELRGVLESQQEATRALERETGQIVPWVFHEKGRPLVDAARRMREPVRRAWKAACQEAGLPGRIPHDFRRTAVRNLVRAGVPERVAMQLTGHKTRSVFDRYDIVNEADLQTAVERLSRTAI